MDVDAIRYIDGVQVDDWASPRARFFNRSFLFANDTALLIMSMAMVTLAIDVWPQSVVVWVVAAPATSLSSLD